ncbi:katanin p80 WD40 repeat-containing subunit B1 homolog isoform X2 [Ananas comosus]|uniref:Katanin p80 WD40 repeat-containing subunit B1 homolog n=1 Tax=Ananas comosus TaxID=4615 RepID=A0A6P5HT87_ANACO|nr:katanin p80 WD40 repeat-containing subunit B1 homolog isoform X2 [Ananas comosus]
MATATKRAYKLQEFVAHSSNVNCLKIGRKTSRVLVTGGEDHKVNLWAIGKPNSILSLSGHTSAVESVSFDSSEVLVAAGAASGTIKLWDLEEAKIVRTLTGHRSNCISVDFHPFGEFFASGSLDTNLKIWDIRRKGCIHTYKGHTRGVNAIRFTPDGRWVVSGGEDNTVKLWDLTAGKLLHDFKCHEGQVQCIDFHPHEFLLATGSADRTVKFWDLETFELIGSAGPETSGVRSMTFNPDGRTLLCGLHESLKVFSWEPIRCHDAVDVGWSRLSDLNVHDKKLLGCSFNQSCVGVWVVDLSRVEPYAMATPARENGHSESKSNSNGNTPLQNDSSTKSSSGRLSVPQDLGRLSVPQDPDGSIKTTMGRLSVSQNSDSGAKEAKPIACVPGTPQRIGLSAAAKPTASSSGPASSTPNLKRNSSKSHSTANVLSFNRADVVPVIVPRTSSRTELASDSIRESGDVIPVIVPRTNPKVEQSSDFRKEMGDVGAVTVAGTSSRVESTLDSRKESVVGRTLPFSLRSKFADRRKPAKINDDSDKDDMGNKVTESNEAMNRPYVSVGNNGNQIMTIGEDQADDIKQVATGRLSSSLPVEPSQTYHHEKYNIRVHKPSDACSVEVSKGGRTRSLVANWESRDQSPSYEGPTTSTSSVNIAAASMPYSSRRGAPAEKEDPSGSDEDAVAGLIEQHELFLGSARSRLTKLQTVHQFWERKDVKGVIHAMGMISDHAVSADVVSVLMEKSDTITLDLCTSLMPLLNTLLESKMERHLGVSLEMLHKLVRTFGPVIHSTLSAGPSVGVDLQAEQRLERCNLCFIELEKVKNRLPSLARRRGSIAKSAQELKLALQEVL